MNEISRTSIITRHVACTYRQDCCTIHVVEDVNDKHLVAFVDNGDFAFHDNSSFIHSAT